MADMQELNALRDIHLPKAVSWWPLAPGWYLLGLTLMAMLLALIVMVYKSRKRGRYKRQALALLADCEKAYLENRQSQIAATQVSDILRRVALLYFPREEVASLQGQAWSDFLSRTSKNIDFNSVRNDLVHLPWQKNTDYVDLGPLFSCARAWIKQRGVPCSN